ncbi:MAG TPA: hypothetical protein VNR87_05275 [Flavisolibacter sp.]|nr:hypothetical protein [Flavisolibacter sp.]
MIPQLENLAPEERQLIFKAPALISVLACCSENGINSTQKKDAIHLAHLKTFTAAPELIPYYRKVEKSFIQNFEAAEKRYQPFDREKRAELLNEIERANQTVKKLDERYANLLLKSFYKYANHVKHSTHSVFQDFLIPLHIPGLNG